MRDDRPPDFESGTAEPSGRSKDRAPLHGRYDSRHRRVHRWPPEQRAPGSWPVRGAYVSRRINRNTRAQLSDGAEVAPPMRQNEHPRNDGTVVASCLRQRSVNTGCQRFSMRGKACGWREYRCSFGKSFVQADEHPCGHLSGPILDRC